MAKTQEDIYLLAERAAYASPLRAGKKKTPGWDSMTQINRHTMFDGLKARPYTNQLSGSPKSRAKSGARSLHAWQRDYNPKGKLDEKVSSLRYQRVAEMKRQALKEAERRKLPVEAVEEEMYQAQSAASKRIDTGIRRVSCKMAAPSRTYTVGGGPPRLFDGNDKLEDDFSLKDAQDMFRGEAWELMAETLETLDEFKPPARSLTAARGGRGSFSSGVTPGELNKATKQSQKKKEAENQIGAADLASLKKLLVRKYGTVWAAWRLHLASDGVAQLSFSAWSKAMRALGFEGNVKAVWKQLDDDNSGLVSFAEFDPEWFERMKSFNGKIKRKYGESWDETWKVIDDDKSNQVDLQEFEEVCANIGYDGPPAELFKQLRSHPSRKFLNKEDFKAIPKNWV